MCLHQSVDRIMTSMKLKVFWSKWR